MKQMKIFLPSLLCIIFSTNAFSQSLNQFFQNNKNASSAKTASKKLQLTEIERKLAEVAKLEEQKIKIESELQQVINAPLNVILRGLDVDNSRIRTDEHFSEIFKIRLKSTFEIKDATGAKIQDVTMKEGSLIFVRENGIDLIFSEDDPRMSRSGCGDFGTATAESAQGIVVYAEFEVFDQQGKARNIKFVSNGPDDLIIYRGKSDCYFFTVTKP